MNNYQQRQQDSATDQVVNAGIATIAAASKTPFKTSFSIVLGMGLARVAIFAIFMTVVAASILTISAIVK